MLRVAVVAAFTDIEVAAGQFQRRIHGLEAAMDGVGAVGHGGGDDLDETAEGHRDEGEHGERQGVLQQLFMPGGPAVMAGFEGAGRPW